jgi:hypothetical protein
MAKLVFAQQEIDPNDDYDGDPQRGLFGYFEGEDVPTEKEILKLCNMEKKLRKDGTVIIESYYKWRISSEELVHQPNKLSERAGLKRYLIGYLEDSLYAEY